MPDLTQIQYKRIYVKQREMERSMIDVDRYPVPTTGLKHHLSWISKRFFIHLYSNEVVRLGSAFINIYNENTNLVF